MTQPDQPKPILDNSFSAFIAGLTVGIAAVLLLGTEEGKKISQKVIQSIPEDLTDLFSSKNPPPSIPPPPLQVIPEPPPPPPPPTKSLPLTFFTTQPSHLGGVKTNQGPNV